MRLWVAEESDPEVALYELDSPEIPRPGDVVGEFTGVTFRVEKRVFLLEPDANGKRTVKGIQLVCKRVIV